MAIFKAAKVEDKRITKLAFKQRMTPQERIGIRTASQSDPVIFDFLDLVSDATFIDLAREENQQGLGYLAQPSVRILTPERANEILNAPIQPTERPEK